MKPRRSHWQQAQPHFWSPCPAASTCGIGTMLQAGTTSSMYAPITLSLGRFIRYHQDECNSTSSWHIIKSFANHKWDVEVRFARRCPCGENIHKHPNMAGSNGEGSHLNLNRGRMWMVGAIYHMHDSRKVDLLYKIIHADANIIAIVPHITSMRPNECCLVKP